MKCKKCGKEIPEQAKFCSNCGQEVEFVIETPTEVVLSGTENFEEKKCFICPYCGDETQYKEAVKYGDPHGFRSSLWFYPAAAVFPFLWLIDYDFDGFITYQCKKCQKRRRLRKIIIWGIIVLSILLVIYGAVSHHEDFCTLGSFFFISAIISNGISISILNKTKHHKNSVSEEHAKRCGALIEEDN